MNFMDALFILMLLGIMALGFFQGVIRLGVLLLAFYLSVVLASLYFPVLGSFIYNRFGGQRVAADYVGFFIVLLLAFSSLAAAGLYTFRYVEVTGRFQYLDRLGGVFLGLILSALVIGMLSVLLWNLMITHGGINVELPLFKMIGGSVQNSFLLRYFGEYILPQTYDIVSPILPSGARIIFDV